MNCQLIENVLPHDLSDKCFALLKSQVEWKTMHHHGGQVPRLISIQGEYGDTIPVYRHPSDELLELVPWSPIVLQIRDILSKTLDQNFNHVLIQYYRSGQDFISEHSDKTLDIKKGTSIVNFSCGATRTMVLRSKKGLQEDRIIKRYELNHNSAFVLDWNTNKEFAHSIRQDKRDDSIKSEQELLENGERISLTFRTIDTFITKPGPDRVIFGQGATGKTIKTANKINNSKEQI
ncbi:hypothetical protein HK103_001868 [Boothiomyces macroporosus]|uniref:Fe2OG dioxygenase domain-containing protein n=1 Tax=Boothiomyces macroporosus TaxID=261099 RepID=A0AAD5U9W1_9FUNG|nr:hypothetical protein HK103_001868 [Boothiomyces macroporosus]